jgi:hypothetical protein
VAHQLRHTSQVYGFFAIVLGLLASLFLGAQLTLYAAEVNVVRTRRLWPRSIVQPPLTGPDRVALHQLAEKEERRPEERVDVRFLGDNQPTPPHANQDPTSKVWVPGISSENGNICRVRVAARPH